MSKPRAIGGRAVVAADADAEVKVKVKVKVEVEGMVSEQGMPEEGLPE